jgi:hypothetical protein
MGGIDETIISVDVRTENEDSLHNLNTNIRGFTEADQE